MNDQSATDLTTHLKRGKETVAAAPEAISTHWHLLTAEETATRLGSTPGRGLTTEEAATRLARHGRNELPSRRAAVRCGCSSASSPTS